MEQCETEGCCSDVTISRECAEKMFSILNNPVLNGKYLEDSAMRTPFFNELKAALGESNE
jgi:hypothetical protein